MPSSRKAWPARGKYAFGKKTFLMKAGMGVCPQWMWPWLFSELVATEAWAGSLKSVFLPVLSLPILETPSVQRHSKQAILQVDSCRGKRTSWSSWLCCETSSPSCFQMGVECPTSEAAWDLLLFFPCISEEGHSLLLCQVNSPPVPLTWLFLISHRAPS